MFKSSKKGANKKNAIVSLLLVAALVITGALAFLTAKDNAENKFTVGNVDITLTEPNWDESNGENIVAGQVIAKDPTITNTGRNEAYVYMMVQVPKADEISIAGNADSVDDYQLFSCTINDGWTLIDEKVDANDANNYYLYAYNTPLVPEGTATLFNEVTYANTTSDFEEASLSIEVTAYAIQSDFYNGEATDAESAWLLYVNQNGWEFPTNLVVAHYTLMSYDGTVKEVNILTDDMTTITLPSNALTTNLADVSFSGWADETGTTYAPGDVIQISSLYITDLETQEIINPNPVITESVTITFENENDFDGSELPVKLVPNSINSTAVIERDGLIESYNDGYTVNSDTYGYEIPDSYDGWYVYGLDTNITIDELFENYIKVQGDGYAEITTVSGNAIGTGAVVRVYNRNGTADKTDDTFVEQFYIVVFSDLNGDSSVNKLDTVIMDSEALGFTSWQFDGPKYMFLAADLNGDKFLIDSADASIMDDVVSGYISIDQTIGYFI